MTLAADRIALGERLADVSLALEPGTITAICGPNGAGKSSLLEALAGLLEMDRGTVALDGADLRDMPARDRAQRVGYLPQAHEIAWDVPVRSLVELGRMPHGDRRAGPVDAALEALDIADLAATVCAHPLRAAGYEFAVPLISSNHVTTEQGSGFVHTAPGHGAEDYEAVMAHNARLGQDGGTRSAIEVPQTVDANGTFFDHVPLFAGVHVYKADDPVAEALRQSDGLLARGKLVHSYPHSWRSKAPLIFRNTPQWFISMSTRGLREKALAAIEEVRWVPAASRTRPTCAARPAPSPPLYSFYFFLFSGR